MSFTGIRIHDFCLVKSTPTPRPRLIPKFSFIKLVYYAVKSHLMLIKKILYWSLIVFIPSINLFVKLLYDMHILGIDVRSVNNFGV